MRTILLVVAVLVITSASAFAQIADAAAGAQEALRRMRGERSGSVAVPLLLFGGENNNTFLGCLNCPDTDPSSVLNPYGAGNRYASDSIANRYGQFGGPYGHYSPCNRYGSDAPVVVDRGGNFYGHLSINRYHVQRFNHDYLNAWLVGFCQAR